MKRNTWARLQALSCLVVICFAVLLAPRAEAADWYWLSSDEKYSLYFDPASVVVTNAAQTSRGKIATEIHAWTKTGYSYAGAKETIATYGISKEIPDPATFSYSLALVSINPQNRELQYREEIFYDAAGNVLWRKDTPGSIKEINSKAFDEKFYAAIVDEAFGMGEMDRLGADDRWLTLWDESDYDGIRTHAQEDTSTMRMKGNQLIGWQWITTKDRSGTVLEIKFLKTAVNLVEGTQRVISGQYWAQGYKGFADMSDSLDGNYHMITPRSYEAKGLAVLRAYAKANEPWLARYSIED